MLDIQARDLCIQVQALVMDAAMEEDSAEEWVSAEDLAVAWVSAEVEDGEWVALPPFGIIRL